MTSSISVRVILIRPPILRMVTVTTGKIICHSLSINLEKPVYETLAVSMPCTGNQPSLLANISLSICPKKNDGRDMPRSTSTVAYGILVGSRRNSEGNGDQKLEYGGNYGDYERRAYPVRREDVLHHGMLRYEGLAEVAAEYVAQPLEVALKDISVKAVRLVQLLRKFFVMRGAALVQGCDEIIDVVCRHAPDKHVQDYRYAEYYYHRKSQSFENIF